MKTSIACKLKQLLLKKIGIFSFLVTLMISACGGGGGGEAAEQSTSTSTDAYGTSCIQSNDSELHGCWQSTCETIDSTLYNKLIVSFLPDGSYTTNIRQYLNADCSGEPFGYGQLLAETYTLGSDFLSSTGTTATKYNLTNSGSLGLSIFDVTASDELCFPTLDYKWESSPSVIGYFAPTIFTENLRSNTIDYSECMTRYLI